MTLFAYLIVPLVSLAVSLRVWWLIYQGGWNKLLPIFNAYVVFYWVSILVIWPFVFWSWLPVKMQRTACLIYANGSCALAIIGLALVIAVIYEVSGYTS